MFTLANILETHKRIHTDEKPFSCKRCDYKCKPSTALKTHERIYTNEKPFSCSQCDYKCSTSGSLRRIKEPTLVISHSAAQSVTGYPVSQGARIAFTQGEAFTYFHFLTKVEHVVFVFWKHRHFKLIICNGSLGWNHLESKIIKWDTAKKSKSLNKALSEK